MGKKNAMSQIHLSGPSATRNSEVGLSPELLVPNNIISELGNKTLLGLDSSAGNGRKDELKKIDVNQQTGIFIPRKDGITISRKRKVDASFTSFEFFFFSSKTPFKAVTSQFGS